MNIDDLKEAGFLFTELEKCIALRKRVLEHTSTYMKITIGRTFGPNTDPDSSGVLTSPEILQNFAKFLKHQEDSLKESLFELGVEFTSSTE